MIENQRDGASPIFRERTKVSTREEKKRNAPPDTRRVVLQPAPAGSVLSDLVAGRT